MAMMNGESAKEDALTAGDSDGHVGMSGIRTEALTPALHDTCALASLLIML